MIKQVILGVDLSTHGAKVLAIDASGGILAHCCQPYERLIGSDGSQIQPLDLMLEAFYTTIRKAITSLPGECRVIGISITHQRGLVIGLDLQGNPVLPAICDSDTRSWEQAKSLKEKYGIQKLVALTGCPPVPFNGLTKILWWYQIHPEEAKKVATWMSVQDWAIWKLSGRRVSHPGSALRQGILDIKKIDLYAEHLLNELKIPLNTLPSLLAYNESLAEVCLEANRQTGLPVGISIFPSPGDQPAAMLGTGAITSADALVNLGTSFLVSFPLQSPAISVGDLTATIEVLPDRRYLLEYGEGAGTNILDWLRTQLFDLPSVDALNSLCADSPCGAKGLMIIPHWWAIMDSKQSGVITGLHNYHTRSDVVRATYEGLVFELRHSWEKMEAVLGTSPSKVAVYGGASGNEFLCQLVANTLNRSVCRVTTTEASALGAVICAAVGCGWASSIDQATTNLIHRQQEILPQIDESIFLQKAYREYLSFRNKRSVE